MNYPNSTFVYEDQSDIQQLPIEQPLVRPIFMAAITSDKGPEDYKLVSDEDFFDLYGSKISFAKHGQPLLQAAAIINAGGTLFVKRVVPEDATLAHLAVIANVAVDSSTGTATVTYRTETAPDTVDRSSLSNIKDYFVGQYDGTSGDYLLFIIGDNGRGVSKKNFQITADYNSSKSVDYTRYMFNVIEDNSTLESIQFGFYPNIIDANVNTSLESRIKFNSKQVECVQFEAQMMSFIEVLAGAAKMTVEEFKETDILFGKTKKGTSVSGITVEGTSLSSYLGLAGGTDGAFEGLTDVTQYADYDKLTARVFSKVGIDPVYSNIIYDRESYKVDAIVDANYGPITKQAIAQYATFREDCMYFRDLGLALSTLEEIIAANNAVDTVGQEVHLKNKFIATYCNSYDIIDPYSKKQIPVTIGYSIAKLLVDHLNNGRNRPFAGLLYNVVMSDAIDGTINFLPAQTPEINEMEELADNRINYVSLHSNVPVLETLYTSQEKHTQFSYINNILAIQEVIKAVREKCPKIRYSFMEGEDLKKYKEDVEAVIDNYSNNFMSITLEYISDTTYISNKIFYAALKVQFRNFVQSEYFKVIALPS